jgi:hypothetical protein
MRKCLWIFGAAIALLGCSKPPVFHIKMQASLCCGVQAYRLMVDRNQVGPFGPDAPYEFDVQGKKGSEPREMLPQIQAQVHWVCGWQPATVYVNAPSEYAMQQAGKEPVPVHASVDFSPPSFGEIRLWVDNRGGGDAVVSVGENEQRIAAGGTTPYMTFPYSSQCEEAKVLRLNGEVIANVPQGRAPGDPPQYLLDTSGARCYTFQNKVYSSWQFGSGQPKPEHPPAEKAHLLADKIDFFLEEAPASIMVQDYERGGAGRLSVVEGKCK